MKIPRWSSGEDPQIIEENDLSFDDGGEGSNEDFSLGDYASDDDIPDYRTQLPGREGSEERRERVLASSNMSLP